MFDHRREHPFYGICRRTGCELDHAVAKRFRDVRRRRLLTQSASAVRLTVSTSAIHAVPDIRPSSGGSDASRVDRTVRGDVVDLAARNADVLELPVIEVRQIGSQPLALAAFLKRIPI